VSRLIRAEILFFKEVIFMFSILGSILVAVATIIEVVASN
jgi:hypothetical protein